MIAQACGGSSKNGWMTMLIPEVNADPTGKITVCNHFNDSSAQVSNVFYDQITLFGVRPFDDVREDLKERTEMTKDKTFAVKGLS